ncbi:MAG TPA: methyltransferase domain-containing protein [Solirubrobacteraceae bacterium]|nr:methyltransferase domain-containing protein [Solirubrobacteraceae bacterium]
MIDYDGELQALYPHLRAAAAIGRGERVLDIGCGAGQTTRDAAQAAGAVLGIDVSEALLELARERSAGLANVSYVLADAATHPFPEAGFDVAISRFGTMFFADPAAAFANIARALRPGGRLAMLVWQAYERNDWVTAIDRVLGVQGDPSGAFSLGDPGTLRRLLAGFEDIRFEEVREPVFYGPDSAAAVAFVSEFQSTRDALGAMAPDEAERALARLHALMDEHHTADGVALDSRAWVVTARRRGLSSGR